LQHPGPPVLAPIGSGTYSESSQATEATSRELAPSIGVLARERVDPELLLTSARPKPSRARNARASAPGPRRPLASTASVRSDSSHRYSA